MQTTIHRATAPPTDKMLQPPTESLAQSRPLSVMTSGTSATAQDKTGETWKTSVDRDNCWEDLILTLGTCNMRSRHSGRYGTLMKALSIAKLAACFVPICGKC